MFDLAVKQITNPLATREIKKKKIITKIRNITAVYNRYILKKLAQPTLNISICIREKPVFWREAFVSQVPAQPALSLASFPEKSKALYTSFQKSHSIISLLLFPNG